MELSLFPDERVAKVLLSSEELMEPLDRKLARDRTYATTQIKSKIEADLDRVMRQLREAFGLKRKDARFDLSDDYAVLSTPWFDYSVRARTDEEQALTYSLVREVQFHDASEVLTNEALLNAFSEWFDAIVVRFSDSVSVADWIDRVEARDVSGISLDYDLKCTWCELTSADAPTILRLEERELRVGRKPGSSANLVDMASWLRTYGA